jgi:hypothetical protein
VIRPFKLNWGADIERDIPLENILPERPPAFNYVECDPPNWAVHAISKRGGKRHPKREITHIPYVYTPPKDADTSGIYERALQKRRQRTQTQTLPAARKQVPQGNLKEDQYRFWKGNTYDMPGAQCRWCTATINTPGGLNEHHIKSECKELLLAVFKFARRRGQPRYCMACKRETNAERWGVPLCNTVACIGRWKFGHRYVLAGFVQYLRWALEADANDPRNGPFLYRRESTDFHKGISFLRSNGESDYGYYGGV